MSSLYLYDSPVHLLPEIWFMVVTCRSKAKGEEGKRIAAILLLFIHYHDLSPITFTFNLALLLCRPLIHVTSDMECIMRLQRCCTRNWTAICRHSDGEEALMEDAIVIHLKSWCFFCPWSLVVRVTSCCHSLSLGYLPF